MKRQAELTALAGALMSLPGRQRDVIVLWYYDRLSASVISRLMKITPEEAEALRHTGETKLEELLRGITD